MITLIEFLASYRRPMPVTEERVYPSGDGYALCPRCRKPIDRDYQAFCSTCGQALDWGEWIIIDDVDEGITDEGWLRIEREHQDLASV